MGTSKYHTWRAIASFVFIWFIWLLIGTVFYSTYDDFGWISGFYYAVNTGYNLGLTFEDAESMYSKLFTVFYLIFSVFAISLIILYATRIRIFDNKRKWYSRYIYNQKKKTDPEANTIWEDIIETNFSDPDFNYFIFMIAVMIVLFIVGIIFCVSALEYNFVDALYLTVSTLTAAGIVSVGNGQEDYVYILLALYTGVGVIVFKLFIYYIDLFFLNKDLIVESDSVLSDRVTAEEIKVIRELGIGNGEGSFELNRSEYLVLILNRLNIYDYDLINHINQKYSEFDSRPINDSSSYTDDDGNSERLPLVFTGDRDRKK